MRFKTIPGYFEEIIQQQTVKVMQNVHALDAAGFPLYELNSTKPLMKQVMVDSTVNVPIRIWVDDKQIPFTPEEEAIADIEEAQNEIKAQSINIDLSAKKKAAIDGLNLKMAGMLFMTDDDIRVIKAKYRIYREKIEKANSQFELDSIEIK